MVVIEREITFGLLIDLIITIMWLSKQNSIQNGLLLIFLNIMKSTNHIDALLLFIISISNYGILKNDTFQ